MVGNTADSQDRPLTTWRLASFISLREAQEIWMMADELVERDGTEDETKQEAEEKDCLTEAENDG